MNQKKINISVKTIKSLLAKELVKMIKSLLAKELYEHYKSACETTYHGVQRAFLHLAYYQIIVPKLESAVTIEDIEELLSDLDYKMSVKEWVDSL